MAPSRLIVQPILLRILCAGLALTGLSACVQTPVTRTVAQAMGLGPSVDNLPLNPDLRYLRVSVQGRTALMVLGYVDEHAAGPIQTWYSREGEVLQLQNGRIVATSGLTANWRSVSYSDLPSWADMMSRTSAEFGRERDEMPGYRFGLTDRVVLRQVRTPDNSALTGLPASELRWYEETVVGTGRSLPSARYGLRVVQGVATVVYGEQCLAPQFCMAWQTLPLKP